MKRKILIFPCSSSSFNAFANEYLNAHTSKFLSNSFTFFTTGTKSASPEINTAVSYAFSYAREIISIAIFISIFFSMGSLNAILSKLALIPYPILLFK